ncbi:MAG: thioredoxin family protein [Chloroflexota bacterium]
MTYPQPAVVSAIHDHFVPVQINTQDDNNKKVIDTYRQAWTPDVRVLGHDGFDYDHWNGYLPPFEFLPRLLLGLGVAALRTGHFEGAGQVFENLSRTFPTSFSAPEATYWQAVSEYRATGEGRTLQTLWRKLQSRYPESIWRTKQSFIEQ